MENSDIQTEDAWDAKVLRLREDMTDVGAYCHFNNAGASPMPRCALDASKTVLDAEHLLGGYEAQSVYSKDINGLYHSIGRLLNEKEPSVEIALVDSATTAWIKAFYSVPLKNGDVILISKVEYAANVVAILQRCKRHGASIVYLPSDEYGCVCLIALESILRSTSAVKIVCITWIPTNGGVVNDAASVGRIVSTCGDRIIYLLDACQAVGHIPVDVQAIKCHMLTGTGRKYLRGPRGTGFLYVSEKTLEILGEPITIDHFAAPWVQLEKYDVASTARRFEQWEKNISGLVGLGVAIDYYLDPMIVGAQWADTRIRNLSAKLRASLLQLNSIDIPGTAGEDFSKPRSSRLPGILHFFSSLGEHEIDKSLPNITLHDLGDSMLPSTRSGIVSFSVNGVDAVSVKSVLREHNIFVSVSSPSSTLIDASDRSLPELVRASVHYFNTELEIFLFCNVIKDLIISTLVG